MSRWREPHRHTADVSHLTEGERFSLVSEILPVPHGHDSDRFRGRHHSAMARARMIRMPMGDNGTVHRCRWVDEKITRRTVKTLRRGAEEIGWLHASDITRALQGSTRRA